LTRILELKKENPSSRSKETSNGVEEEEEEGWREKKEKKNPGRER